MKKKCLTAFQKKIFFSAFAEYCVTNDMCQSNYCNKFICEREIHILTWIFIFGLIIIFALISLIIYIPIYIRKHRNRGNEDLAGIRLSQITEYFLPKNEDEQSVMSEESV